MDNEKLNILRLLIENQDKEFSIRQIALKIKVNYKTAYTSITKLSKEGVISLVEHRNITLVKFNRMFNESVFIVEYMRLKELLKNKNFKVIYRRISNISSQFILLLFGSYAKKSQTKHSDIDLLLIADKADEVEKQLRLIPLNIHLTSIKYADFIAMLKSKEFTVVSEAIKHNIILFGVEDYYRLVKNTS